MSLGHGGRADTWGNETQDWVNGRIKILLIETEVRKGSQFWKACV